MNLYLAVHSALALLATAAQASQTPPPARELFRHEKPILQLAATDDGSMLLTSCEGSKVQAWSRKQERVAWSIELPKGGRAMHLDAGEESVAYALGYPGATVHSLKDGKRLSNVGGSASIEEYATCLAFDSKGRWAWVGTQMGVAHRVIPSDVGSWSRRPLKNEGITCCALDARDKWLALGGKDFSIRFINSESASTDDDKIFVGHEQPVSALVFDPKGAKLVSGDESGKLIVWTVTSGKPSPAWSAHTKRVQSLAMHPQGKWVASAGADGSIELWDLGSRERLRTLAPAGPSAVVSLAVLDKGKSLASAAGTAVTLWDLSQL